MPCGTGSGRSRPAQMARRKCHPAVVRAAYLEIPFSGHRARHEALDYFAGYAAVTGPTVVIPDQRTAISPSALGQLTRFEPSMILSRTAGRRLMGWSGRAPRRLPQCVDSLVMPASENLDTSGHD
jgi:hypothetical protein